jgi:hypothetical protein
LAECPFLFGVNVPRYLAVVARSFSKSKQVSSDKSGSLTQLAARRRQDWLIAPVIKPTILATSDLAAHNRLCMRSRKFWSVFSCVQILGLTAVYYGRAALYSESVLFLSLAFLGRLLLLPGYVVGGAFADTFSTSRIDLPITVIANALFWLACAWLVQSVREHIAGMRRHRQGIALWAMTLTFVVINIIHSQRSAWCDDCFRPHGIPFTLYHEGGYAGGAAIVWTGLVADALIVLGTAWLVGRLWGWTAERRTSARCSE